MSDPLDDLRAHVAWFAELGTTGVRLEADWQIRQSQPAVAGAADAMPPSGDPGEGDEATGAVLQTASKGLAVADGIAGISPTAIATVLSGDALSAIRLDIGDCTRCKLHGLGRRQIVFGIGSAQASLMFVGEAPGAEEDVQGQPFVGRAGQLLTKIIEAIGLRRDEVYIANVIKCRPPQNRNPEPDEVAQCEPFLFRQIDTVRPKVIVALGKFAAQSLLRTTEPITKIRGREFAYRDAVLMPTYHPAYLLRNPPAKREVWEDMKRVKQLLEAP